GLKIARLKPSVVIQADTAEEFVEKSWNLPWPEIIGKAILGADDGKYTCNKTPPTDIQNFK
ncbi:hypothetical protein HK100_006416, partial [Physocladia obscura]